MSEESNPTETFLLNRQMMYQSTFNSPAGQEVLKDMEGFCRAHQSTFHENIQVSATLDGRREYYLRVRDHLELSSEELCEKYTGVKSNE